MVDLDNSSTSTIQFFNKGYVTTDVSSIKSFESNTSKENRIRWVTDLAAVSRGLSESKNPDKRFISLTEEAALKTASRPLEFLPVVLDKDRVKYLDEILFSSYTHNNLMNSIGRFGYFENGKIYTNCRALINAGLTLEQIPYNDPEDLKMFKAIKIKVPMFIWSQLMTHTMLSKESQSDRVSEENDYYLPDDFSKRLSSLDAKSIKCVFNKLTDNDLNKLKNKINDLIRLNDNDNWTINYLLNNLSQRELFALFEILGYKREIWSRAMYYFKYKVMVMTGWINDPLTWRNLFLERNCVPSIWKNWTQKETMETVLNIKKILGM